jgi:uncharacterized coiled-coil protein SlyX
MIFLGSGCGFQPAKYFPWGEPEETDVVQEEIADGNRFFWKGEYAAAEAVFLRLQRSDNPDVTRQALYGLACTRLLMAENRQAYLDAVEILMLWQEMSPAVSDREDPRMLLAIFSATVQGNPDEEAHVLLQLLDSKKQVRALENRIVALERRLAASDREAASADEMSASVEEMKKRLSAKEESLEAMAEELVKLKSQLKTLETIDQEIQEKKQGISSP